MIVANEILERMKKFLDGKTDPEEFSFDFPVTLADSFTDLEKENSQLAELLNEDLPEICSYFEPDDGCRDRPEYLNEDQFRRKVAAVYEQALKLV